MTCANHCDSWYYRIMINKEDIGQVYSGRPGCCCGCRGKHYREGEPGFERMRSRVVNTMNARSSEVEDESNHYFLDMGNRWYVAYLREA